MIRPLIIDLWNHYVIENPLKQNGKWIVDHKIID